MKIIIYALFSLFLVNGSNEVKCFTFPQRNPPSECAYCKENPCDDEEPASLCHKISIKNLILLFLKKSSSLWGNAHNCEECPRCQSTYSKKHEKVFKVLTDILRKAACSTKKEDESIKEIIRKLLNTPHCEETPCLPQCDPEVRKVLKAILRKASGCNCKGSCNCLTHPPHCGQEQYKYWFKATKETMRKEICGTIQPEDTKYECCTDDDEGEKGEKQVVCPQCDKKLAVKFRVKKKPKCECAKCKACQRPNNLICPRYITNDCPVTGKTNSFSICADCVQCQILPTNQKNHVLMYCTDCKALNSPFVQFTRNGYPFKQVSERQAGIQTRTKFLQINDFRTNGVEPSKAVFNPFHKNCNIPTKKRKRKT